MQLMKIRQFQSKAFAPGSAPCRATIIRWLREGLYPGTRDKKGRWWIDYDAFVAQINGSENDPVEQRIQATAP